MRRFAAKPRRPPEGLPPRITVLKPLHGLEPNLYAHLNTLCDQDYSAAVQIIFGFSSVDDPAIAIVRRLQAEYPDRRLDLVINAKRHGSNAKVCNLTNMLPMAQHEVLVIADSDMIVPRDYLSRLAADLEQPGVGLVTCLYTGQAPNAGYESGVWSRMGELHINHGFMPSVMLADWLGNNPGCYGATMALSRDTLSRLGGFSCINDHLADDYWLGHAIRKQGLRVALSPMVVTTSVHEPDFETLAGHELRWARTIRSITPAGFAGSLITHATSWALLGLVCSGFAIGGWIAVMIAVITRLLLVTRIDRCYNLPRTALWEAVARDLLSFALAIASFSGAQVTWRNSVFMVASNGQMILSEDESS